MTRSEPHLVMPPGVPETRRLWAYVSRRGQDQVLYVTWSFTQWGLEMHRQFYPGRVLHWQRRACELIAYMEPTANPYGWRLCRDVVAWAKATKASRRLEGMPFSDLEIQFRLWQKGMR